MHITEERATQMLMQYPELDEFFGTLHSTIEALNSGLQQSYELIKQATELPGIGGTPSGGEFLNEVDKRRKLIIDALVQATKGVNQLKELVKK